MRLNKRQATEKAPRLAFATGISSTMAEWSSLAWFSRSSSRGSSPRRHLTPFPAAGSCKLPGSASLVTDRSSASMMGVEGRMAHGHLTPREASSWRYITGGVILKLGETQPCLAGPRPEPVLSLRLAQNLWSTIDVAAGHFPTIGPDSSLTTLVQVGLIKPPSRPLQ
jgi:hypothetical protein